MNYFNTLGSKVQEYLVVFPRAVTFKYLKIVTGDFKTYIKRVKFHSNDCNHFYFQTKGEF